MAAETVIESFCERCGTRYVAEPVRRREGRLAGLGKQLGILADPVQASRDPFHGSFHFCLECRQYTCPRCWNEVAGFCLGCMPLPGSDDQATLDAAELEAGLEAASWRDESAARLAAIASPGAWPDADLHRDAAIPTEPAHETPPEPPSGADPSPGPDEVPDADGVVDPDDAWSLDFESALADAPEPVVDDLPVGPALIASSMPADAEAGDVDVAGDPAAIEASDQGDDVAAEAEAVVEAEAEAGVEAEAEAGASAEADLSVPGRASDTPRDADPLIEVAAGASHPHGPDAVSEVVPGAVSAVEPIIASEGGASPDETRDASAVTELDEVGPVDDDLEADWADLMRQSPAESADEPLVDDWEAMALTLGPDIAPAQPLTTPSRPIAQDAPPDTTPAPMPTAPWRLTAPVPDGEARPAQWPPLGSVFRPQPVAPLAAPHPSVLGARTPAIGAEARGQAGGGRMPSSGVRPCGGCELPLSANARFCRRCGRRQD